MTVTGRSCASAESFEFFDVLLQMSLVNELITGDEEERYSIDSQDRIYSRRMDINTEQYGVRVQVAPSGTPSSVHQYPMKCGLRKPVQSGWISAIVKQLYGYLSDAASG